MRQISFHKETNKTTNWQHKHAYQESNRNIWVRYTKQTVKNKQTNKQTKVMQQGREEKKGEVTTCQHFICNTSNTSKQQQAWPSCLSADKVTISVRKMVFCVMGVFMQAMSSTLNGKFKLWKTIYKKQLFVVCNLPLPKITATLCLSHSLWSMVNVPHLFNHKLYSFIWLMRKIFIG